MTNYRSIDLFSGCGGLSVGMVQAGFSIKCAIDNDFDAIETYKLNFPGVQTILGDVRQLTANDFRDSLGSEKLHLLAGCPPCQGFSSIRRLNKKEEVHDERNDLVLEYYTLVKELKPHTIMMENVPGLVNYDNFNRMVTNLREVLKYHIDYRVVNIKNYGVPQSRKRLVLIGSRLGEIKVGEETCERVTVRDAIGNVVSPKDSLDPIHKMIAKHTPRVMKMIKLIPKNGGSRKDLPSEFILKCHKKKNVGFHDVYGRLRWDDYSTTITGGCLNPSKGRFLHPEEDRVISAREASLLQTFPPDYKFPEGISKTSLALLIGNALPPKFSYIQSRNIIEHLKKYNV